MITREQMAVLKAAVTKNYKHPNLAIIDWTRLIELMGDGRANNGLRVVPVMYELAELGLLRRVMPTADIYDQGSWYLTADGIQAVKQAINPTDTIFICNKHEQFIKELDAKGLVKPYSREIVNQCYIQPGTSAQTRCKGIATGWRVDVAREHYNTIRGGTVPVDKAVQS